MTDPIDTQTVPPTADSSSDTDMFDTLLALASHLRLIVGGALLVGVLALGGSYLVKPTFTAATVLLPPQQQSSLAASALSSLGSLAGLVGGASQVLDGVDGQFARLTGRQSAGGAFWDSVLDRYSEGAVVIGLTLYLVRLPVPFPLWQVAVFGKDPAQA